MASGTGNLPNDGMVFNPFDILTAEEMNELVANIEALADGTGLGDLSVPNSAIANGAVTPEKLKSGSGTSWEWQSWSASVSGWSSLTVNVTRHIRIGNMVTIVVDIAGTSNSTTATINLPFAAKNIGAGTFVGAPIWTVINNGTLSNGVGRAYVATSTTPSLLSIDKDLVGASWTSSGTKAVRFVLTYEAA